MHGSYYLTVFLPPTKNGVSLPSFTCQNNICNVNGAGPSPGRIHLPKSSTTYRIVVGIGVTQSIWSKQTDQVAA